MKGSMVRSDFPMSSFDIEDCWKVHCNEYDRNRESLDEQDKQAEMDGTMVGRYIEEGIADGCATYVIVKENKRTVKIRHVTGLGDDYMIGYWGKEATIHKAYAKTHLTCRDAGPGTIRVY